MNLVTGGEPTALGPSGTVRLLLRAEEGAESIGVSRAKFYQLLSSGEIRSIRIGRSRRIPISALQDWIARQLADQSA